MGKQSPLQPILVRRLTQSHPLLQDNVVDFRWHKSTQSPNWSLLARECWLKSEVLPSVAEEGDDGITISTKLPEWVKRSSESSESGKDVCSVAEDAAKIKTETRGSSKLHTSAVTSGEAPSTTATPVDDDQDELQIPSVGL